MAEVLVVAVDGPAASGKSTLARRLAAALDLPFLDTGLLYRAVARRMLDADEDAGDEAAALRAARALNAAEVTPERLGGEVIGQGASKIAAFVAVRDALLPFQRDFARGGRGAVLAGRDTGTVVCPDAEVKLFVTAGVEERARRRFEELRRLDRRVTYAAVLDEIGKRDRRDAERAVAPLRAAPDAMLLDTTTLDVDAALDAALTHTERVRRARGTARSPQDLDPPSSPGAPRHPDH